ncbi:hypothetical protein KKP89_00785 [Methanothermococcus sp. SCGC AD-155-N22]|nr:hypothetical protein [Methanothermococcus sp. SCGC AD-155-N22]
MGLCMINDNDDDNTDSLIITLRDRDFFTFIVPIVVLFYIRTLRTLTGIILL